MKENPFSSYLGGRIPSWKSSICKFITRKFLLGKSITRTNETKGDHSCKTSYRFYLFLINKAKCYVKIRIYTVIFMFYASIFGDYLVCVILYFLTVVLLTLSFTYGQHFVLS